MQSQNNQGHHAHRTPLLAGAGFLLLALIAELVAILVLNKGVFTYTLDDPYIHLALAENIATGHYGVNQGEFSAPSSSILWPFMIAIWPSSEHFPLLLNIVFAFFTVFVFHRVTDQSFSNSRGPAKTGVMSAMLVVLVCATNTVGLVFTGMEHSLQLLLVAVVVYGLVLEAQTHEAPWWLLLALVAAPLVRYENLAISGATLVYLFAHGHRRRAVGSMVILFLLVAAFSVFLDQLGLGRFPASILEKSSVVGSGGQFDQIMGNIRYNLAGGRGKLLAVVMIGLGFYFHHRRHARHDRQRHLAALTMFAIMMHLVAGRCGWYHRYEIYIWAFSLLMCCHFLGSHISTLSTPSSLFTKSSETGGQGGLARVVLAMSLTTAACTPYLIGLFTIPFAANNTYEQQYQMHRFAVDYYDKPVAVNDLGLVSYKNRHYVLDLWGLASLEALKHRKSNHDPAWMSVLAKSKEVELAMIYASWFKKIPEGWTKAGSLRFGRQLITSGGNEVTFYALNQEALPGIVDKLREFQKTLPQDVSLTLSPPVEPEPARQTGR